MYDLDLAKNTTLWLSNVPSYSPETIAEYSVSIALQLVRRFPDIERQGTSTWFYFGKQKSCLKPVKIWLLQLSVMGRIGAATAKIYAGFGATITAYDAYPNKDLDF